MKRLQILAMVVAVSDVLVAQDARLPEPFGSWIQEKIEKLGHADMEVREQAQKALRDLREVLNETLSQALHSDNVEVRVRAEALVKRIVVVLVKACRTVTVGPVRVYFEMKGESDPLRFHVFDVEFDHVEAVNGEGQTVPVKPGQGNHPPEGFGRPVALRVYLKSEGVTGKIEDAPILIPVKSHQDVTVGALTVSFGCITQNQLLFSTKGGEVARVVLVDNEGRKAEYIPKQRSPGEKTLVVEYSIGKPKEMHVFLRKP